MFSLINFEKNTSFHILPPKLAHMHVHTHIHTECVMSKIEIKYMLNFKKHTVNVWSYNLLLKQDAFCTKVLNIVYS